MIRIHVFNTHPRYRVHRREVTLLARAVLSGERKKQAEMNIVFLDDKDIISLNADFLHHSHTTDVLSFTLSESKSKILEGEVYVNLDQARRQAPRFHATIRSEVARLIIHGILHLTGYDDGTRRQKDLMTKKENHYLQKMKYLPRKGTL